MTNSQVIHFIGIGGIGVSALAKYYLHEGAKVSGSDLKSSEITDELRNLGVKIKIGKHKKNNVPKDADLVIYTAATPKDNSELKAALKLSKSNFHGKIPPNPPFIKGGEGGFIKVQSYAEAIGELTKKYKTVAITGSHGKSTTTALSALVLEEGYFDPTVIVGTKIKEFRNSNFRMGHGGYLVLEADEWNKSFLNYFPEIAIVTNVDVEHLDTFKNAAGVEKTFTEFLKRVPKTGKIIANRDDPRLKKIAGKFGKKVIWYSLKDKEAEKIREVLRIPGEHNVSNALAALRLGKLLGIRESEIYHALSRFSGAWRRFEFRGVLNGASIFTDYGHHPQEIIATLKAAREKFPFRRIWCVYQPHQYQRLYYLWDDFLTAFDLADKVVLLPVYDVAGRETKSAKAKVNSKILAKELISRGKNTKYIDSFEKAEKHIKGNVRPGDIILIMGAGDIYELAKHIAPNV